LVAVGLTVLQAAPTFALAAQEKDRSRQPAPPAAAKVVPNRTAPHVIAPPTAPRFSSPPTDAEFFRVRVFDEPLMPLPGPRVAAEDSALANAILARARAGASEDISAFEGFLTKYPDSRWKGALLLDMGIVYRRTGYITRALDAWEQAWGVLKDETDLRLRALADRAVGELAELSSRLGRYDRLERLFSEIEGRDVRGPAGEKIVAAREGFAVMQTEPERAFLCGPFGLDRILASTRPGYVRDRKIADAKSTRQGTSMRQMLELAKSVGLKMQIAKREPGAPVIVPALVHWNAGHFAAMVQEKDGRLLIQDPTFGDNLWISKAAFDDQASGYFLVPVAILPAGWTAVPASGGDAVWGKGIVGSGNEQFQGCTMSNGGTGSSGNNSASGNNNASTGTGSCNGCPTNLYMAGYTVNLLLVNLHISDAPVGYAPPVGPSMLFQLAYNQREVFQPQVPAYSNLGPKWTFDWFSFIEDNPANLSQDVNIYLRQGGQESYGGFSPSNGTSGVHYRSRAVLVRTSASTYERRLANGAVETFAQADGGVGYPRRVYLTQYSDPQGNHISYTYSYEPTSGGLRLTSATDAIGQVTTLSYDHPDPLKITKVTDPFGRFATFGYDGSGRLSRITDVIGIASEFAYGPNDFITSLTTPYGTTQFETGQQGANRWLQATDPVGGEERFEFLGVTDQIPFSEPVAPSGMAGSGLMGYFNGWLTARNTFYWDKLSMAAVPTKDYTKAHIYHWLHSGANQNVASGILESEKLPLEGRIWYNYPGQTWTNFEGTAATPSEIGRVLDDGMTQLYKYEYNSRGKPIKETDPVGRETVYVYGTNNVPDPDPVTGTGIDLLQVKQKNGGSYDVLASYTYNAQHLPLTHIDAGGQTTTFTYNAQGQIATVTTPPRAGITENRTTTYTYDTNGYLQSIAGPAAGSTRAYTYDAYGRVRTTTNSDGYTVTYDYDALDRQTKATYPDGTYEETVYNRLDPEKRRDRLGRWGETFYDALRRPVAMRDPLGRTTTQQWCTCGSLDKTIDSNGNATSWGRDLQGRMTSETRADGAQWNYVYENTTSRLKQVTDAKSQTATFDYFLDNHAKQITYTNATTPTPTVSFTFDTIYDRIASVMDGTGATTYAYYPVTGSPSVSALRLASLDGPLTNDTVVYTYDELGRLASRGATGYVTNHSYDSLGRRTTVATPVGSYNYAFDGVTSRPLTVTYPNGQSANYTYFGNSGNRLVQEIKHLAPGGAILSKNNYTYDAAFEIKTWTQQVGANPANVYELSHDNADQLTAATLKTTDPTPTILKRYAYNYDKAGNRDAEQVDDSVLSGTYNSRNQLTSRQPGGALLFRGTVNEPATVTVGGKPATVDASNKFQGAVTVPSGTSNVVVTATDPSGNLRTNTYQVGASGTTTGYTYDANGNLTAAGSRTFEWDARNQLAAVILGTRRTEYTYDWAGRRVRVLEKDGATVLSDRRYVWGDSLLLEERDGVSGSVLKRFYESVTDEAGTLYFETRDHQGNVREVTDGSGGLVARYDYDPYGRLTQTSGTRLALFSYTGQWLEQGASGAPQAGLYYYRARYYDPETARFLSEDPARSRSSPTLYAYVGNNPTNRVDPTGLQAVKCNCPDDKKPQVQNAFQQVCKLMLVNSGCAMALVTYGMTSCYAKLCTTPPAITCTPDPSPPCAWTSPFNTGSGPIFLNTGAFSNKPCGTPNLTGLIAHEMYHVCAGGCDVVSPGCTEAQAAFTNARTSAIQNACSGL
jgi:RHS repeat-associated protein